MRSPPATDLVVGGARQGEEDDEEFYETLDRILSSSSSSTSASVSDDDSGPASGAYHNGHRQRRRDPPPPLLIPAPSFSATNFDLWLRIPSSVEERRHRLLRQLGLDDDPTLSRPRPAAPDPLPPSTVTGWTYSGGSAPDPASQPDLTPSPPLSGPRTTDSPAHALDYPHREAECSSPSVPMTPAAADCEDGSASESGRESCGVDPYCMIKNLDSGEKFVVKGVREDGMWDELRDVRTGRQLTMEEFQTNVIGHSPIVQELLRRENREGTGSVGCKKEGSKGGRKRSGGWFRSIRSMASTVVPSPRGDKRSSDEKDTSSEKGCGGGGGRRSSSATDDSQAEGHTHHGATERVRVRQYGKSYKELTGLYRNQVICAHSGSIWTIKFSLDGCYLASAGEDCVIHVWQVVESDRKLDVTEDAPLNSPLAMAIVGSPEPAMLLEGNGLEKRRRARASGFRKSFSCLDHVVVPEKVFALSEKPVCSFHGHTKDVLDLSWSKSQRLLSSSMDKTVRLWDLCSKTCLKTFSHSDYVTCIQFNPVDDNYFISGSLDNKVRLWNIEKRQVVDWNDMHEMITAACYTPDGQGAFVGTHKGSCLGYNTSDNKLQKKGSVSLQIRRKRSHLRKITGFQFAPGSSRELFVTSADSRIRVVDDLKLVHRFKGFRNKTSQISASLTADGEHVVCASEDSHVYIWNYNANSQPSRNLGTPTVSQSYEQFLCRNVSVALAWPGNCVDKVQRSNSFCHDNSDLSVTSLLHALPNGANESSSRSLDSAVGPANSNHFTDRASATWPEEQLSTTTYKHITHTTGESNYQVHSLSAWGMVIVTAGHDGEIKIFQNFGYPVRA